jgi:hypothetical protein
MRPRERVAARVHGAMGSPNAVEWSVRRHTRPAGRGTLSQNRYSEWLNAKPFRSFRSAEP